MKAGATLRKRVAARRGARTVEPPVAYAALCGLISLTASVAIADEFSLGAIHADIVQRYAGVQHLDGRALHAMRADDVLLFDVRAPEEFAVSHLTGARRLGPDERLRDVLGDDETLHGKTIVFYCSVGHRSSAKARELKGTLTARGAAAVYNLTGGIFQWRNDGRPLTNGVEATVFVHPYNDRWGRLIDDPTTIRYTAP